MSSNKQAIQTALNQFNQSELFEAAINLFNTLGYNTSRQSRLDNPSKEGFKAVFVAPDDTFDEGKALFSDWQQVDLLFQLTQAEVMNETSLFDTGTVDRTRIEAYLFWAIDLLPRANDDKTPKPYSRTDLAQATRELNRLFPMPCLVLFRHDSCLTLAVIDRRLHKRDDTRDVLEKVTLIKDIALDKTHPGHLTILEDLSFGELYRQHRFDSFVALHRAWQKTLDTSLLNKRFYEELFMWYLWAKSHPQLWFPKPDGEKLDDEAYRSVSVIRLLTRLIFVWFIKEKGLVPDQLFNQNALKELLKDFNATSAQAADFYRAILQNLFFATLNTPMAKDTNLPDEKRQFVGPGQKGYNPAYGDQTKYRYADCFRDPQAALRVFETVPFLNGGLFECLDYPANKDLNQPERRYDGFSMTETKQARVPNQLFFGDYDPTPQVLAEMGGRPRRGLKLTGLVDILNSYKFTLTENTPLEEEVALDPELLGKVFENLLASYNPETQATARKQTGSFYTPREIVSYMVDESLKAYLLQKLTPAVQVAQTELGRKQTQLFGNGVKRGQLSMLEIVASRPAMPEAEARQKIDDLFADGQTTNPFADNPATGQTLIEAISEAKILDPAAGSGAFPMGILHRMVNLLGKLDPDNEYWRELQRQQALRDTEKAYRLGDRQQREDRLRQISDAFENNASDYGRKLFLIENCIYGVDIQQVAVQIAKLRFFISLIVDQRVDNARPNRNVLSMPNLETKFVAANTLISLEKPSQLNVFGDSAEVKQIETDLHDLRKEVFFVRGHRDKKRLQKAEAQKREELQRVLEKSGYPAGTATQIAGWNPFDVMRSSGFFDPITMFNFGAEQGFDIVIGNPPYVQIQKLDTATKTLLERQRYQTYTRTGDLYQLFYEAGMNALRPNGLLAFITSNKWMKAGYGQTLRKYLTDRCNTLQLLDFGGFQVFDATVDTNILLVEKAPYTGQTQSVVFSREAKDLTNMSDFIRQHTAPTTLGSPDAGWVILSSAESRIRHKIEEAGKPLKDWDVNIYRGILTGYNDAFIISGATRDELIRLDAGSADIIRPVLRGRDIKRYRAEFADKWIIFTRRGIDIKKYPAIQDHLRQYYNELLPKQDGAATGRKPGAYKWFEIQDNIAYFEDLDKVKIIYPEITKYLPFVYDEAKYYINNKTFFMIGERLKFLAAFFNSTLFKAVFSDYFPDLGEDRRELRKVFFEQMRVLIPPPKTEQEICLVVDDILKSKDARLDTTSLEKEIDSLIYGLYNLTDPEIAFVKAAGQI